MHIVITLSLATILTSAVVGWMVINALISMHKQKRDRLRRIKEIERAERREKFVGKLKGITNFRSRATVRPPRLPKM